MASRPTALRRLAAALALLAGAASVCVLVLAAVEQFPAGLIAAGAGGVAVAAAWVAATRRGAVRALACAAVLAALAGVVVVLVWQHVLVELALIAGLAALSGACAELAYGGGSGADAGAAGRLARGDGTHTDTDAQPARAQRVGPVQRGVLLMNPWSGGGKVERFHLAAEARQRGIEPVVLESGADLRRLALEAVGRGAEMLGMAGGDGSQAIVAAVAMEHELPYACIPAGTRNHLALDLGVDRDDVLGALDAYTDGVERRIDLASVGGRVFVNNVSLGLYAEIVQSDRYRDAKLKTAADLLPDLAGPHAQGFDLRFEGPDGEPGAPAQLVLVSNNPYRLDQLFGLGSRPRMDGGRLGILAVAIGGGADASAFVALEAAGQARRFHGWSEWTAESFDVHAERDVPAGVDGEALALAPPLHFRILPGALRVRLARHHPGRSPAQLRPRLSRRSVAGFARFALRGTEPGAYTER